LGVTRVLFIVDSVWGGGGAETSLLRLIRSLPADRYECRVLTFHSDELAKPFLAQFPCPVDHWQMVSLHHPSTLRLSWRLSRLVRDQKIDIVHTFFPVSDLWAGPIAKLNGARMLISSRRDMGILRKRWHGPLYRLLNGFYDEVHAVSEQVRRYTIETDGLDPTRIRTVYNGVDDDYGQGSPSNLSARPMVTTVAHVRRVKGIDVFLRAAAQVHRACPEARFRVAGVFGTNAEQVSYKNEVLELQSALGLEEHVQFLGMCSDIPAVLKASDVFVLPSRSEGFSNALLEAMMCALPCVATSVGGNAELVVDGETGFLVPPEDPREMAARIVELLRDAPRRIAIGAQGRQRTLAKFTSSVMTAGVMASYEKLQKRKTVR
jgi:glycosyltransferase involved in cell wall biosynthesis